MKISTVISKLVIISFFGHDLLSAQAEEEVKDLRSLVTTYGETMVNAMMGMNASSQGAKYNDSSISIDYSYGPSFIATHRNVGHGTITANDMAISRLESRPAGGEFRVVHQFVKDGYGDEAAHEVTKIEQKLLAQGIDGDQIARNLVTQILKWKKDPTSFDVEILKSLVPAEIRRDLYNLYSNLRGVTPTDEEYASIIKKLHTKDLAFSTSTEAKQIEPEKLERSRQVKPTNDASQKMSALDQYIQFNQSRQSALEKNPK